MELSVANSFKKNKSLSLRKKVTAPFLPAYLELMNQAAPQKLSGMLSKVERDLLELSRNVHQADVIQYNLNYMRSLAKLNIPTQLIREVLANEELLMQVAGRSYEHVNHFDKIVLVDNKDPKGYRLTLHSWNCIYSKKVLEEELIHNHRFSFWSHVYKGTLISENFEESSNFSVEKKDLKKFIYTPSATGNIHTCAFENKIQLNRLGETVVKEGETYYLNYKTIHRVLLPTSGHNLCTFVLRGPREREYTNTYNTFYPDRGMESSVPMMSPDQLKEKLIKILGV